MVREPVIRTLRGARLFLQQHHESARAYSCYLGHYDCSTYSDGPCLDETLSNFPEAEEDE